MVNALGLLVFVSSFLWAMDDPKPFKTSVTPVTSADTHQNTSYLSIIPAAVGTQILAQYAVKEKDPRDNRKDLIIERGKSVGQFSQLARTIWHAELDEQPLLDEAVAYANAHPEQDSHFNPNIISVTSALSIDQEKKKHALLRRLNVFASLDQKQKDKAVVDAIKACPYFEVIAPMIEANASVHAQDPVSKCTLLHFASRSGDSRLVEFLLKKGAHVDAVDRLDETPLHTAVHHSNYEAAKLLLENQAQVNLWDWHKNSALFYAVVYNNLALVRLLLHYGASIYYFDASQDENDPHDDIFTRNVLAIAVGHRNLTLLTLLLHARSVSQPASMALEMMINAALVVAAKEGNHSIVNFLLQLGDPKQSTITFSAPEVRPKITPDLVLDEHSAVGYALLHNHFWLAEKLFCYSTDNYASVMPHCRSSRRDSLRIAVQKLCQLSIQNKKTKQIKQLQKLIALFLEEEVEPASGLRPSAAFIAAQFGNIHLLRSLLDYAKKTEPAAHQKLLFEAATAGSVVAVRSILSIPTSACVADKDGETPLHKAVLILDQQNISLVDDLIAHGADVAAKNNVKGDTPLHKVIKHPNKIEQEAVILRLIKQLETEGRLSCIDAQNKEGNTPLMSLCAISQDASNLIHLLAQKGARLNMQNSKGQTALFIAAAQDSAQNVLALLEHNADPNVTNYDGCGPLTKAARNGNKKMIDALICAGAKLEKFKDGMLREAAKGGHISCMNWLIQQGAAINGQSSSYGNTPLHKAVAYRQYEAIEFLIKAGADSGAKNYKSETPLDIAIGLPDAECASLLYHQINRLLVKN